MLRLTNSTARQVLLGCYVFVLGISLTPVAPAVTYDNKNTGRQTRKSVPQYIRDLASLRSENYIQISATSRTLTLPEDDIKIRMLNPKKDYRIEPLQLTVSPDDDKILALAGRLAKPERKLALAYYLRENLPVSEPIPGTDLKLVTITPKSLDWINRDELDQLFAKDHFKLTVNTANLQKDAAKRDKLLRQIALYLTSDQLQTVKKKIQKGLPLDVDTELLPPFARAAVTHHTIFKGPNCFHAALSFQSSIYAKSPYINVREEPGYHRDMLNYDELWRAVQAGFYEVNPDTSPLQYGDMVVFFETAKAAQTANVDFTTLRHASTYLFGGYAFAKGSKSANSPYVIRPLADEWATWTTYTEKLGVKVFRRNLKHVKNAKLWEPHDWMY